MQRSKQTSSAQTSIVLQAGFIVGAAFEIVEDDLWQVPLGEDAVASTLTGFADMSSSVRIPQRG
jgi:hypothetical protein